MIDQTRRDTGQYEILVVEDSPHGLRYLTHLLENRGYIVRAASDGPLALQSVAARLPDLILLDVKMDEMDGYEVCRRLKSEDHSSKVPIIFFSALGETVDKVKGFRAGGVDYITKPIEPEEVFARVGTHLQLQELTHRLEKQVAERTALLHKQNIELAHSRERVEAASIAKSKFLGNMSHELRSPLTPILGYAHILKMQDNLTAEQKDQLQIICDACTHMTRMIGDILDIANIDLGKESVEYVEFNLQGSISEIVDISRKKAHTKNLAVRYEEMNLLPEIVSGDKRMFCQVLHHLMDNGVKFTEQGGVLLRACVIQNPKSVRPDSESEAKWRLRFDVVDTGIGIPITQMEDIFKPFYQGEMEDRLIAGTGLGLALSRRLVEAMGGSLSVQSPSLLRSEFEEWPGSIFTLELDFGTAEGDDKQPLSSRETERL